MKITQRTNTFFIEADAGYRAVGNATAALLVTIFLQVIKHYSKTNQESIICNFMKGINEGGARNSLQKYI